MYRYLPLAILHKCMKYGRCMLKSTQFIVSESKCWRTDSLTHQMSIGRPPSGGALHYISLYAPITLDECHASIHLYWLRRAVSNGKRATNSKWKYVSSGIRTQAENGLRKLTQRPGPLGHPTEILRRFLNSYTIIAYEQKQRAMTHVSNWLWLEVYWNRLSDKICISFTNVDIINYCIRILHEYITP